MRVHLQNDILQNFPAASVHGVVFGQLDLFDEDVVGEWRAKAIQSLQDHQIHPELMTEVPAIQEWRDAYRNFGLKPSKYRSSIEQLLRRASKGEIIQTGIPLVDIYCYISIIGMAPMGAYDLRKTTGDISIRYTEPGEEFLPIGGSQILKSEPGIVAYADASGIICWAWNHRDSAHTCLSRETTTAIFFADSAAKDSYGRAEHGIDLLSEILSSAGCVKIHRFVLDHQKGETNFWV